MAQITEPLLLSLSPSSRHVVFLFRSMRKLDNRSRRIRNLDIIAKPVSYAYRVNAVLRVTPFSASQRRRRCHEDTEITRRRCGSSSLLRRVIRAALRELYRRVCEKSVADQVCFAYRESRARFYRERNFTSRHYKLRDDPSFRPLRGVLFSLIYKESRPRQRSA